MLTIAGHRSPCTSFHGPTHFIDSFLSPCYAAHRLLLTPCPQHFILEYQHQQCSASRPSSLPPFDFLLSFSKVHTYHQLCYHNSSQSSRRSPSAQPLPSVAPDRSPLNPRQTGTSNPQSPFPPSYHPNPLPSSQDGSISWTYFTFAHKIHSKVLVRLARKLKSAVVATSLSLVMAVERR